MIEQKYQQVSGNTHILLWSINCVRVYKIVINAHAQFLRAPGDAFKLLGLSHEESKAKYVLDLYDISPYLRSWNQQKFDILLDK